MKYLLVVALAVVEIMISGVIGKVLDRLDEKEEHAPDEHLWLPYVKHDPKD